MEGQAPACPRRAGTRSPALESSTHPGNHHRNPARPTGMEDHAPPALTRSPFPRHRWFYRATLMDPPIDTSPWHEAARGGASSRLPAKVGKTSAVSRIEHPSWTSSPQPHPAHGHGGPCPSSAGALLMTHVSFLIGSEASIRRPDLPRHRQTATRDGGHAMEGQAPACPR